ncbi:MAG: cation diffusion facilitator family transporter [Methanoregula sp.]
MIHHQDNPEYPPKDDHVHSHETGHTGYFVDPHRHDKNQSHHDSHTHTHGIVDPSIFSNERGIQAVKWSFAGLFITALFQLVIVYYSGSIALFADTLHNFGDALTAIPLFFAFVLARRQPTKRFTYGYGRVEDLAGVFVVLMILISAIVAGYVSIERLFYPQQVTFIWAVAAAALIGCIGNEAVAQVRIRVGKEIGSAALVADGYHARSDGLASLAVLAGAVGVYFGFPLADPVIGLVITMMIVWITWKSGKTIFLRFLDGVDPAITDEIHHTGEHIDGVIAITDVKIRWLGHRLHAEITITVRSSLTVEEAHAIAREFQHELLHHLKYLYDATIHVDPETASGPGCHHVDEHVHNGLPAHSH